MSADGHDCEISSYINSLHPIQHAALYPLIGKLFCHCVPLLEQVLAELGEWHPFQNSRHVRYTPPSARDRHRRIDPGLDWWKGRPLKRDDYEQQQQQQQQQQSREKDETEEPATRRPYDEYYLHWYEDAANFRPPTIPKFQSHPAPQFTQERASVSLRNRPLQVIVKIASMELDPEQDQKSMDKDTSSLSSYDCGVWHVEGSLGERIVATACCYLECTNVQGGALAFRTSVQEPEDYRQFDHTGVQLMYNLVTEGTLLQPSGSPCVTKQGRILAWPNTKQYCVQPVQLVDSTKPGKRTICCFFLVDPTVRIRQFLHNKRLGSSKHKSKKQSWTHPPPSDQL